MKTCHVLLSLVLSLGCFATARAQERKIPAPVSVIIDSYQSIQELPHPGWMIMEGDTPLTIQDLLKGDIKDGQVMKIQPDEIVIKKYEKYWFALEISSEVELRNWLLHVENKYTGFGFSNNFSEIRSYTVQEGQLVGSGITGFFVPASERDFRSRDRHTQSLLNLNLNSGSRVTFWVHIKKNVTITSTFPELTIYDSSVTLPTDTLKDPFFVFFGSFLVIWILSLFMYFYLRDLTSLWFFIFLTAALVQNLASWSSDPLTTLLYPENPKYGLYFGLIASILNVVFCLQFSRVFANLSKKHRKLDKFMLAAIGILAFSGFLLLLSIPFEKTALSAVYFAIFGGIYVLSGISYLSLKDSLSRIIGLALLLFIIPQFVPFPFEGTKYLPISGLLVTVTIGVGYRIKILFQERLLAENEKKNLLIHQNSILEKQVANRTSELNNSLKDLRATQSQLVQQEKLASLGQLTAGIAHEIQNPLNFVNNFSEVSVELLEEVKESRARSQEIRPKTEADENEDEILEDIKKNLEKITHYGKRADSIVKGMLEHSRSSTGEKVLTDINALADEYLRLAYHGIRAKDKSFSAEFETCFDPDLPKVSIVPQDIGRVLLNLINNSFFAVNERKKKGEGEYSPMVTVSTKKIENKVLISVSDNGTGIPESIRDKIFQPFYTTKPTGQGTGLGLSLSYDIVKAHGGELMVESSEGECSMFIIQIPVS
jgi:signal transduction histidine kinase